MATKPPPLVDLHGQPLRKDLLQQEIAGPTTSGVRSIMQGHPAQNLTPQKLASLLLEAEQGNAIAYYELAEEMEEKDLHYLSVLGTRKRAVAQLPISVEPADDSAEAEADAKLIEDWIERDTLETELFDILDAIGKGISHVEVIWDTAEIWQPSQLKWRHASWFEFDRIDGETPMLRGDGGQPEPLEYGKFISHVHSAKSGLPVRGGLARAVAWGWMFKNYAIKDWVGFLEMYGQPIRVGRFDVGASEGDVRKLMRAVSQIGTDAAAVFPRTMDIEFIDGKAGAAPNELWRSLAEYIDDQVSKAVLGQTSSSDAKAGGLGSGQADLHGEVRDDIARADAKLLAATLNRDLVRPMIQLNRGARTKYPRIKIGKPDPVDVKGMVEAAERLVPLGVEVDAEEMRELAGLPAPKSAASKRLVAGQSAPPANSAQEPTGARRGPVPAKTSSSPFLDPLKTGKTGNGTDGGRRAVASAANASVEPDAIDLATDELLGDWDEMFDAIVDPLAEMLATSSSLEDARAKLARQIETMDMGTFQEKLARAGFAAHLAGEIDVQTEQGGG